MFRSILIVSLLLSVTSALNSCSNEPCWEYPDYLHTTGTDSVGTSDRGRAITLLLCYMQCQEKDEEFTLCQDNCTATFQLSSQTPSLPPPNTAPVVTRADDDGLYSITLPDVITYGSGDTGSTELGLEDELYLIQVSQFENDIFFPATSLFKEINLAQFACSEVNISFAVVTSSGDISKYSPSHTTCIFLPQRDPDAAEHLEITFEEDLDRPQKAIVYIAWDSPSDITRLEGYQLLVEYISGDDDDCAEQDNMAYNIEREMTNFTIHPKEGPSPLYSCTYAISLKSFPGNNTVSKDVTFRYRSRSKLNHSCVATYIPKDVKYNLNVSWTIVDERALDAITGYALTLSTNDGKYLPHHSAIINVKQEDHQTDFVHVYPIKVEKDGIVFTVKVRPTRINQNEEYHWRRPLVPLSDECDFTIDTVPPDQISSDFIDVDIKPIDHSSRVLSFTVSWDPPYINGRLKWYELCVGGDPLTAITQACESPSDCLYVQGPESSSTPSTVGCSQLKLASPDMLVGDVDYHFRRGTEELYIQIRAVNDFDLFGNWSEPILLLDINDNLLNNTTVPGPTSSSDASLVWVYVLAVVAFLLLVAVLIVLFICIYRHFCFHRRIKYEHSMQLGEQNGRYPHPIPPPVADEWELQWEDVEVHYNEELGTGAFGMVYRGLLHSRELRDLMDQKRGSSRRSRRGSGRKSPYQKKLSAHRSMGSCTVAIKRLKENIDGPDKANFLKEIEMMKKVSGTNHDHQKFVVNMLGCVTLQEPMMLVLEYATSGDLLSYLRDSRDESTTVEPKAAPYLEPVGAYSQLTTKREGDTTLTAKDLLSFARQIAAGMEFLASLGVVHRDLACRNILVCKDNMVKISDFGLSRLLVNQEVYVTTTKGVLPIRWMAPEALFYRTFDTQSDVWSFGILLWELYTLGGYPYPTRSNREILELLTTGYRMDKPELCSDEVYEVMLQCWSPLGLDRPTFEALYIQFDSLLGETTKHQTPYVQLLGTYYYDKLTPKQNSNDQELLDLESIPANVDTRRQSQQTTLDPSNVGAHGRSLQEASNGFSRHPDQSYINEARGRPFNQAQQSTQGPPEMASTHRSGSPNRNRTRQTVPDPTRRNENLDSRLSVPLHLSRPRSWVGGTSTELEPRYVTTPLYPNSPRSSTSNLTEETTFSMVNTSSENRLNGSQSRSVGNIPLLTNENLSTNL